MRTTILWCAFLVATAFQFLNATNSDTKNRFYIEAENIQFEDDGIFLEVNNQIVQVSNISHDENGFYFSKASSQKS